MGNDEEQSQQSESEQQGELFEEYTAPDYTDTATWVRVETPELVRITRGNDEGLEVQSGRVLVSYRRRVPEDGDAEVIREKPKSTYRAAPEEKVEFRKWGEAGPKVDPRISATRSRYLGADNRNAAYYDWLDSQGRSR